MRAREIMTSPAITVTPEVPVRAAAALLVPHGSTALPVVDHDNRLVGIVAEADLLRNGHVDESSGKTVGEVMTSPAVSTDVGARGSKLARTDTTVAAEAQRVPDLDGGGRKWTVVVRQGEAVVGADNAGEETERVLAALAGSVPDVLRVRVLTGGER